jgi:hypothetical protein
VSRSYVHVDFMHKHGVDQQHTMQHVCLPLFKVALVILQRIEHCVGAWPVQACGAVPMHESSSTVPERCAMCRRQQQWLRTLPVKATG